MRIAYISDPNTKVKKLTKADLFRSLVKDTLRIRRHIDLLTAKKVLKKELEEIEVLKQSLNEK